MPLSQTVTGTGSACFELQITELHTGSTPVSRLLSLTSMSVRNHRVVVYASHSLLGSAWYMNKQQVVTHFYFSAMPQGLWDLVPQPEIKPSAIALRAPDS